MRTLDPVASTSLSLPANSYIYSVIHHESATHSLLAAISSDDSLRFVDPLTLSPLPDGVIQNTHEKGITCLKSGDENVLVTGGRDGVVKFWDIRDGKKAMEFRTKKREPISALETYFPTTQMWTGVESEKDGPSDAPIYTWDIRSTKEPLIIYADSHNDTITELHFSRTTHPSILLSGSTDGYINVFDTLQPNEDDALQYTINNQSAIHHALGLPSHDFSTIFALSTDETLTIHPGYREKDALTGEEPEDERKEVALGDLRALLGCDYVVDLRVDVGRVVVVAGRNRYQHLDLIPLDAPSDGSLNFTPNFENTIRLPGAHGEEIVRDLLISDSNPPTTFTCGEDGHIRAWRLPMVQEDVVMTGEPPAKKTKTKHGGGSKKDRFKPY